MEFTFSQPNYGLLNVFTFPDPVGPTADHELPNLRAASVGDTTPTLAGTANDQGSQPQT